MKKIAIELQNLQSTRNNGKNVLAPLHLMVRFIADCSFHSHINLMFLQLCGFFLQSGTSRLV